MKRLGVLMAGLAAFCGPVFAEGEALAALSACGLTDKAAALPGAAYSAWEGKPEGEVVHLRPEWEAILKGFEKIGEVSVVSGNASVIHAGTGSYTPFSVNGPHGLVLDKGIDLRLSLGDWAYGVADLTTPGFAFFDAAGVPVHRVLLTEASDKAAFEALAAEFKGEAKPFAAPAADEADAPVSTPLTEEDKTAFLKAWSELQDTHDFGKMLYDHDVTRTQALEIAEGTYTERWERDSFGKLFEDIAAKSVGILVFVLNDGVVQIHGGPIASVTNDGGVYRLHGAKSELIVAGGTIGSVWRVSKPTKRGVAHSIELYNTAGEPVAYIFGSRKEGDENMVAWNAMLNVPAEAEAHAKAE